jgi:hypothetical protein
MKWIAAALAALLSGCTYLDPHISPDPIPYKAAADAPLPQTAGAVDVADQWYRSAAKKGNDVTKEQRWGNIITFGLATGAVAAPLYKAHRDLTMAFTIGAGSAYTATTLFMPVSTAVLYHAASSSFQCVAERGRAVIAAATPANPQTYAVAHEDCLDSVAQAKLRTARTTWTQDQAQAASMDGTIAAKLRSAAEATRIKLTEAIDNSTVGPDAILDAAKSSVKLSFSSALPTSGPPASGKSIACQDPAIVKEAVAQAESATAYLVSRSSGLRSAINGVDDLSNACRLASPTVAALTLSREDVTLKKDDSVTVFITGGRQPYIVQWETGPKGDVVLEQHSPTSLTVRGTSTLTDNADYTLRVNDSSAVPGVKSLAVKARK